MIKVHEENYPNSITSFSIKASSEDRGRIIGKDGELINAIRTVIGHVAMRQGKMKPTLKVLN